MIKHFFGIALDIGLKLKVIGQKRKSIIVKHTTLILNDMDTVGVVKTRKEKK
jgi:hypothetical protein